MPRCFEPPPLVQAVLNALLSVLAAAVALHAVRIPENFVSEGSNQRGGRGGTHCRLELGGYGKQFSCGSEFCLYCPWLGPIPANDVRAARVGCALSSAAVRDRRLRSRGGTLHSQGTQRRGLPASRRPSQAARRLGLLERARPAAVRAVLTLAPHAAAGAARRCAADSTGRGQAEQASAATTSCAYPSPR